MAARWRVGEETLTACNVELFHMDTLDESSGLNTVETLQSCIDPSILSIFEDMPTMEAKGLDEESEASLLTALTEILDNVDDENLSPFDTLPDSDLLSNQKGREHSPLKRLVGQSRSPAEKDLLCSSRPLLTGKTVPRMHPDPLQRSDGEEDDDSSLAPSPVRHEHNLLDWEGLSLQLPVNFEQGAEDGLSVSLGDLVRHMHPYCMAVCLENDDAEQMLPEGGILLEIVDQAENGDPILVIPDLDLPLSLPLKGQSTENKQQVCDEATEVASDSSEHIVVDDEDDITVTEPLVTVASASSELRSDAKDKTITKKHEKFPSRRKKKKKRKEEPRPELVEGRVLRSGRVRRIPQTEIPQNRSVKEEKKAKEAKVPLAATPACFSEKPKEENVCQAKSQTGIATTAAMNTQTLASVSTVPDTALLNTGLEESRSVYSPPTQSSQKPGDLPTPASETLETVVPLTVVPPLSSAPGPITPQTAPPVAKAPEPKPKSLSLAEYRRLRQQKKPAPMEKHDGNSTKWPSLQELPKELPRIPCLPDPTINDRRPSATKKEVDEVKPAWQPRGPAAPPTPEALLVPPAYMVSSASRVSAAVPKPQQTPYKPSAPQKPPAPAPSTAEQLPILQNANVQPIGTVVPQSSTTPVSFKEGGESSPVLSGGNGAVSQPVSPKSAEPPKTCPQTTTEVICAPQNTGVSPRGPEATAATSLTKATTSTSRSSTTTVGVGQLNPSPAAHPSESQCQKVQPVVLETKKNSTTSQKKTKSPTQVLIESFTSEMGIEAADLTSLLEQFEEVQSKEEQCVPEVSGRAAAVGNSSVELAPENLMVERVKTYLLSSTAALTPPATPPHQMWKPLAPVALLGKSKATEAAKLSSSKAIQIEPRPLPSVRACSKPTRATATVAPQLACMDHDYCLPNRGSSDGEPGKHWNVKQQAFITIKPIKQPTAATPQTPPAVLASPAKAQPAVIAKAQHFPLTKALDDRTNGEEGNSILETPDASPARQDSDSTVKESPRRGASGRSYRQRAPTRSRKRSHRSSSPLCSDSESDSHSFRSRSPSKKRYRPRLSESSSSSSSRSSSSVSCSPPRRRRYSYSSSRSGSWSRSRSRSRSPDRRVHWHESRRLHSPSYNPGYGHSMKTDCEESRRRKEKAIEERRVVYVGRIRGSMTQKELRERFSLFGEVEDCTLHFRDQGDNYGFVTYYNTTNAFTAIENGSKLRKPDELPFDLCFGGRRQFCKTNYSDLDSSREYDPFPATRKFNALDFDTLLKQAQQKLKR